MGKRILILDIETTGFSKTKDSIVELGIVELDLDTGDRKIIFDKIFCPDVELEALQESWIIKNQYMDILDIIFADPLDIHALDIQAILNSYTNGATAFNNSFDFGFMEENGFTFPKKLDCPMVLATDICKIPGRYKGKFKWPNVEEAYNFFFPGNSYTELHRGGDDAYHEAAIVHELYKLGVFKL